MTSPNNRTKAAELRATAAIMKPAMAVEMLSEADALDIVDAEYVALGYNPDQARDDHGRFGEGSGASERAVAAAGAAVTRGTKEILREDRGHEGRPVEKSRLAGERSAIAKTTGAAVDHEMAAEAHSAAAKAQFQASRTGGLRATAHQEAGMAHKDAAKAHEDAASTAPVHGWKASGSSTKAEFGGLGGPYGVHYEIKPSATEKGTYDVHHEDRGVVASAKSVGEAKDLAERDAAAGRGFRRQPGEH